MYGRHVTILGLATITLVVILAACVNPREGYAPTQPIAFSHQLHAGTNQIPCQYCHVAVGEGPHASVPGTNTCMNCHSQVQKVDPKTNEMSPEIKKIYEAWETGTPVEWVKVHDLPDHVRFIHQPHINRGFDCTECHGEVEKMDVVETVNPFNMGWCIDCHRNPPDDHKRPASTDCVTCHY